jgi:ABC-type nitrate/sulfonate/bicarbonate transport system substrate-binding protein
MNRQAFGAMAGVFLSAVFCAGEAQAQKLVFAIPGVPPIYTSVIAYTADKEGLFKKYGADVELRQFDSGTAGARAAVAGDVDFAISATGLVVSQVANAGVDLVGIYGFPNPDWAIGSTDAGKASCQDMIGQPVAIDTPGGARSLALKDMLAGCGLQLNQVQQVSLGSQAREAMIAGQLTFGVLHLDDAPEIEAHGKKVTIVTTLAKTVPTSHYLLGIARRDHLAQKRDAYVKMIAGLIASSHFMADPKNADAVGEIGTVTGHDAAMAKDALKRFLAIGFWALEDDGMAKNKIDAVIQDQVATGNIKPGKAPPTYDQLIDQSVWRDAMALYKKNP